jgi:hypothetical protein
MITAGGIFAAVAILRFFKDEAGETLADRGLERLTASERRKCVPPAMATPGGVDAIMPVCYNAPNT